MSSLKRYLDFYLTSEHATSVAKGKPMSQLTFYDEEGQRILTFPSQKMKMKRNPLPNQWIPPEEWIPLEALATWFSTFEDDVLPSSLLERYGGLSVLAPEGLFECVDFPKVEARPLGDLIQETRRQEQSGRLDRAMRFLVSAEWVVGVVQARQEGYYRVDLMISVGLEMKPNSGILARMTDPNRPAAEWYAVGKRLPERKGPQRR